jgi:hypothetical protein
MMLVDFDQLVPEVDSTLMDIAYTNVIAMVESHILTWRQMHSPRELLDMADETQRDDEFFFRGGAVALESLKLELEGERATQFLS